MANKKITELTAIVGNTIQGDDMLHIIDDPTGTPINKSVLVNDLFENIPGLLNLTQAPEQLSINGAISLDKVITTLTLSTSNTTHSLPDGSIGQLKFIVMTVQGTGYATVVPTGLLGASSIKFDGVGHSALLLYTSYGWAIISINGAVPA